jgi:hypothetical protein
MTPGYGQYNDYYDPVGSQANQPQGSEYPNQSAATSASQSASTAYAAPQYPRYGASTYSNSQQYGSATSRQQSDARRNSCATSSATRARVGGMSRLDTQASSNRTSSTQHHDIKAGSWGDLNHTSQYNTSLQPPARSQINTSPQYANSTSTSTLGRSSYTVPSQQTQSSATNYNQNNYNQQSTSQNYASGGTSDTSRQAYGATQQRQTATEPSRYASPLRAVQAQLQQQQSRQSHNRQPSRSPNHQTSPVINLHAPLQVPDHRQSSASVEPPNNTVDPSQVYDFRAGRENKAKAEAGKRCKMEDIEAAKRAEGTRIAEEKRKADKAVRQAEEAKRQAEEMKRQAEELRVNGERRWAEQAKRKADEKTAAVKAAVKVEAARKKEEQRKIRESKSAADISASFATSSNVQDSENMPPPVSDEEAEMRAMFQKMREFNSKNPAMLAKLWEEERRCYAVQSPSPQPSVATAPASKPSARKKIAPVMPLSASTATRNQVKAFHGATMTGPTHTAPSVNGSPTHNQVSKASIPQANASQVTVSHTHVPAANTHFWPPGKKCLLAEIAARWLHSVNPHRVVTTSEILERLDMNPNYVQLCESLEAMGLRFERAVFARELLRGIPPAVPMSQTSLKATETSIMSANGTVAQANRMAAPSTNNPKHKRPRATKTEMDQRHPLNLVDGLNKKRKGKSVDPSGDGMVDYEIPSFSVGDDYLAGGYVTHASEQAATVSNQLSGRNSQFSISNDPGRQPSLSVQPERWSTSWVQQGTPTPVASAQTTEELKPLSPPRKPADKEEAARKRGFGDLVDLTAGDSDDEGLPPMRAMKVSQAPRPSELQRHIQRIRQPHQPNQQIKQPSMPSADPFAKSRVLPPSNASSPGNAGSPFQAPGTTKLYLSQGFGTAPTAFMSAATAPMTGPSVAPMMKLPVLLSDASQPIRRKGPTNEQLQYERVRENMVVEPIVRDRVARRSTYDSRTIARDVLLATGRHPDMRPLNSHLNAMQKLLGDKGGMSDQSGNKSNLATIKWDILDPDPPTKIKAPLKKQLEQQNVQEEKNITQSTEVDGEDVDDEEDLPSALAPEGSMRGSAFDLRNNANPNANASANNKPLEPTEVPKKRGRPPKSAQNTSAFSSVNGPAEQASIRPSGTLREMSTQPPTTPGSGAVGYAAFRKYEANGNEIKKKGRPVGWRKSVHSREAQGLTPKKFGNAKPKPSSARPESQLQEPKYQVYKCHWRNCDAELHSLEVLKKHITRVHGGPDPDTKKYRCMWRDCNLNIANSTFEVISDWLAHVDKEHLQAVAWRLGDGPRGGLSGELLADV